MGYTPTAWAGFGGALAVVAGALTGLLFVALSVKGTALPKSAPLRFRAAQTLVLFMTSVMIAFVLAAPQPATAVGRQLLALAVLSGAGLLALDRYAGHTSEPGAARFVERFSPNTITALLVWRCRNHRRRSRRGRVVLADPGRRSEPYRWCRQHLALRGSGTELAR
jgi:uncharacterized membrane protein